MDPHLFASHGHLILVVHFDEPPGGFAVGGWNPKVLDRNPPQWFHFVLGAWLLSAAVAVN